MCYACVCGVRVVHVCVVYECVRVCHVHEPLCKLNIEIQKEMFFSVFRRRRSYKSCVYEATSLCFDLLRIFLSILMQIKFDCLSMLLQ